MWISSLQFHFNRFRRTHFLLKHVYSHFKIHGIFVKQIFSVVFFGQRLGTAHSKSWLKSAYSSFSKVFTRF